MGFNTVYQQLKELFPSIDPRVLKAVSIEHSHDAAAAVSVVLDEVIPFMPPLPSSPAPAPCQEHQRSSRTSNGEVDHGDGSFSLKNKRMEEACSSSSSKPVSDSIGSANNANYVNGNSHTYSTTLIEEALNDFLVSRSPTSFASGSHDSVSGSFRTEMATSLRNAEDINGDAGLGFFEASSASIIENNTNDDHDQAHWTSDGDGLDSQIRPENNEEVVTDQTLDAKSETLEHKYGGVISTSNEHQDGSRDNGFPDGSRDNSFPPTSDLDAVNISKDLQEGSGLDGTAYEEGISMAEHDILCGLQSEIDRSAAANNCEQISGSFDSILKQGESVSEMFDIDHESGMNILVTRSGQSCRVDLLEDMIEDARNNKKTLLTAMDSVINIMREVEDKEKAVEKAREEAAKGGVDILAKVEDLKKMLQHAKEANNMHAGEVYGEKAILATEARELQLRLLTLSDERDKSLAILKEMRQTLESRLAAAEGKIKKAEEEKTQKEQSARIALVQQEVIMEKVVQEAKMLQEEAEENSKLQEFLMDRGRTVDILQGEISVICQDVRLLKEKFDDHVPLGKSVSSSQTSCILASSGSSLRSLVSVQVPTEANESSKETSPASSIHEELAKSSYEEKKASENCKELVDDGWEWEELYDNDA